MKILESICVSFCAWIGHEWTSAAMEGKPPTQEQLDIDIEGFYDYAKMYCGRCGHVSELSKNRGV